MSSGNIPALVLASMILATSVEATVASASPIVTFIGDVALSGNGTDLSGLPSTILEDGVSRQNALNGFGSGIAYTGFASRYLLLADRGPNKVAYPGGAAVDNTTSYDNRYQIFDITVSCGSTVSCTQANTTISAGNVGTTLLKNAQGVQFTGLSTGFSTNPQVQGHRLDPESIRVAPDGTVYISDEYGPFIYHFDQKGNQIGALPIPANVTIAKPGATATAEGPPTNTTGRVTNRGFEGLAISPDGKTLVAGLQSPLIQDGGTGALYTRIFVYDLTNPNAQPKQYLYQLHSTATAISDLVALNNSLFLVDERDGTSGPSGVKQLYEININQAGVTDLTNTAFGTSATLGLPSSGPLPAGLTALSSTLYADIGQLLNAANPFVPGTGGLPDKIEGYAFGPDLPDGGHLLLATNDNDFSDTSQVPGFPNYIFAFEVRDADFVAESFPPGFVFPTPGPPTLVLLVIGIVGRGVMFRRRPFGSTR